ADEVGHVRAPDGVQERLERTSHGARDDAIRGGDVFNSRSRADCLERYFRVARELHLDAMEPDAVQLVEVRDLHQPARADDADAVAYVLDLGKDVRRKEDCRPIFASVGDQVEELLLVQRVEAAGRLVEDEQRGLMHESEDDAELSLVAAGVFAVPAAEVEAEAVGQAAYDLEVRATPQRSEVSDHLGAAEASELGHLARHVADLALDGNVLAQ